MSLHIMDIQLLNQNNQEFQPYIPDPLLCGAQEDLGTRLVALLKTTI